MLESQSLGIWDAWPLQGAPSERLHLARGREQIQAARRAQPNAPNALQVMVFGRDHPGIRCSAMIAMWVPHGSTEPHEMRWEFHGISGSLDPNLAPPTFVWSQSSSFSDIFSAPGIKPNSTMAPAEPRWQVGGTRGGDQKTGRLRMLRFPPHSAGVMMKITTNWQSHFGSTIRFWDDGLWPNLQNSTNTNTLWLQLWLWQSLAESLFFFAICIGHAGSFQNRFLLHVIYVMICSGLAFMKHVYHHVSRCCCRQYLTFRQASVIPVHKLYTNLVSNCYADQSPAFDGQRSEHR